MPLSILLIMSIGLVVGAALQCLAPLNFRPGIFFGVTVDPEFCRTEDAQRILWSYRRPIIVMTVLCIATLWLVVPRLGGPAAPIAASALVFLGVSVCDRFDGPSDQTRACICKAAISDPDGIRHIEEADAARRLASALRANADCRHSALATALEARVDAG
jgi:hypothetical protein